MFYILHFSFLVPGMASKGETRHLEPSSRSQQIVDDTFLSKLTHVLHWRHTHTNSTMTCNCSAKVHADVAMVNVNVWLAPDSANLGSAQTGDEGGLTVFHAQPPGAKTMPWRPTIRYFARRADGMMPQYSGSAWWCGLLFST